MSQPSFQSKNISEVLALLTREPTVITMTDYRRNRRLVHTLVDAGERITVTHHGKKLHDLWSAPQLYRVLGASFQQFAGDRETTALLTKIVKTVKVQ